MTTFGKSLFEYAPIIKGDINTFDDSREYIGVAITPKMPTKGLRETKVRTNEKYRSDKIADRLWDDPTLTWILDEANNFMGKDCFMKYEINAVIKYPDRNALQILGIL